MRSRPAGKPTQGLRLGVHLPLAKGLGAALEAAKRLRLESVQIFSGNPRSFTPKELDPDQAAEFGQGLAAAGIGPLVIHAPYLLNLASPEEEGWRRSLIMLKREMARTVALGGSLLVFHPGSHLKSGSENGINRLAEAMRIGLAEGPEEVVLTVENTAGAGAGLGGPLEELARILEAAGGGQRVAVCLDTAHAFGAGYDIRTAQGVDGWLAEAERLFGLEKIAAIHLNDSSRDLGSRLDRHEDIGKGLIGPAGLSRVLAHPGLSGKPGILETPKSSEADDRRNLAQARRLRTLGLKKQETAGAS